MATYLVTGGAGFFGTIMKKILLDRGHKVVSIDLEPDSLEHPNFTAHRGDINDDALIISNLGFAKVRDSIILNNTDMLQGSSNYLLDYNWWGNTFKDFTRPNDLNISSWLVLNATPDVNKLENNHRAQVQFAFYSNGTKYLNMPEITLTLTPVKGSVDVSTTSAYSKVTFTLTGFSNASLIAGYNNIKVVIDFEFLKSNPNINVKSNDIMFGDVLFIQITTPSDAKGNITVSIANITKTSGITSSNTVFNFSSGVT